MAQKKLEIKNFKIEEIHPYENNPRFNKDAVSKVAASIKKFGFKNPILVDKDNVIIAGHTRLEAAKKLKLDEVPCIVASDLTEKQAKALRLADNKVAEFSTWDYLKLDQELAELGDAFDFKDFGFGGALADDSFGAGNSAGGSFVESDDIPETEEEFHEEGSLPQELQGVDISAGVQEKIVGTDEVPMERVIIVFKKEEREALCKILGLKELSKVVYRLDELNAVR
jgi:ParB-like chromosome segregation protein Spo0J